MLYIDMTTIEHEPERGVTRLESPLRPFASGADGYFAGGKVVLDGQLYQVSCNVIRIGSNLEPDAEERRGFVAAQHAAKEAVRAAREAAKLTAAAK